MSRKKIAFVAVGLLVAAGALAAVAAQGHRGGWHKHPHMHEDFDSIGFGRGGKFGREISKSDFDARVRERFARLDRNSDGVIQASEIGTAMADRHEGRKWRRGRGADQSGGSLARYLDADRDGKITVDEVRADFARRFDEADLNRNGRIDDQDLPPLMRGREAIGEGGPRMRWLQGADADKDGAVSRDEAVALAVRHHARFDRNRDGVVDAADRDALRQEMTNYRVQRFTHHFGGTPASGVSREQFAAKAAERFARFDYNRDDKLTRDEMPWGGRHRGWGRWSRDEGHSARDRADMSRDGKAEGGADERRKD